MDSSDSTYELIVLGATGYTGKLVAEHITTVLPTDIKWAVAGRNAQKLKNLTESLRKLNPDRIQPGVLTVSLKSNELESLARKTQVLINCVGPYHLYSTPVVEACVNTGTHYLDISGEPPWYKEIIDKFDERAKANKAIIMPQCGFDSTPADMLSWILVNYIRKSLAVPTREVIFSAEEVKMVASGGTLATAISLFNHYTKEDIQKILNPFSLCPVTRNEVYDTRSPVTKYLGVRQEPDLGILTSSPLGPGDIVLVYRSWGLLDEGLLYGNKFFFSSHLRAKNYLTAALFHIALYSFLAILAFVPPARMIMKQLAPQSGEGPDTTEAKKSRTFIRAVGVADAPSKKRAMATLDYPSGPYHYTAVSVAEAAMVIVRGGPTEATRRGGGVLTPATLGGQYVDRLTKADVDMDVNLI